MRPRHDGSQDKASSLPGRQPTAYSALQRFLHWAIALGVLMLLASGYYMVKRYVATGNDALTVTIFECHKLIGFILLWLSVVRLAVRLRHGAPALPASMPDWQRRSARVVQTLLYALLVIVPGLGWCGAAADGILRLPFGLELPAITARNDDLGWRIFWWHCVIAFTMAGIATVHAIAALHHLVVLRDGVFDRMWRGRRRD